MLRKSRLFEISPKKIWHGVLNSGFPQPDYFPSRKFSSGFPINPPSLALLSPGAK
ncbi:hypothetical protein ANA_P20006 (plasmid) [Anabaena sp. 90]|nr:hypothetical protein ANA_P20006 [Anabaena sp. 90]